MKKSGKSKKTTSNTQESKEDEYFTKEEVKRLDKFHKLTDNKFNDDEIYPILCKYKDDDEAVLNELKEMLKDKKGEGEWHDIGKRN